MNGISFEIYKDKLLLVDDELEKITASYTAGLRKFPKMELEAMDLFWENKKRENKILLGYEVDQADLKKIEKTDVNSGLFLYMEEYKKKLAQTYQKHFDELWHVSGISGLKELKASRQCRDAYLNEIIDGIFAFSDYTGNLIFTARAAVGKVYVMGERYCIFPENPLDENGMLKKTVSIYHIPAAGFEPTVDFRRSENSDGFEFVFCREWILRCGSVSCTESRTNRLPEDFGTVLKGFYCTTSLTWEKVCRFCMEKNRLTPEEKIRRLLERKWILQF